MLKQLRLISLLILVSSTAAAANYKGEAMPAPAPCPSVKALHDGFYLGVAGGYDSYRVRRSTNLTFGGLTITGNPAVSTTGFVGGLFAGYGQAFENLYYLGGEIFVNDSDANVSSSRSNTTATSVYSTSVNVRTSYGLALLPGVMVNDSSLLYLRLGYNWANIKGNETFTVGATSTSASKSSTRGGYNVGLGIETAVYQNFSVRGEYSYSSYNSFTSALGTKYSPYDNQFMLGLIYHFA